MFIVMEGRKEIKTFSLLTEAFKYATMLVWKQPLAKKTAREVARTTTYSIVEV